VRKVCTRLPATGTALLGQLDRPVDGGARGVAVAGAEVCLGETREKVGFEVSAEGKYLRSKASRAARESVTAR
jgi:hypothetical protein